MTSIRQLLATLIPKIFLELKPLSVRRKNTGPGKLITPPAVHGNVEG